MREDIAQRWIADLRTPGLAQGKFNLRTPEGDCCLGRLCIVLGYSLEVDECGSCHVRRHPDGPTIEPECTGVLPDEVILDAGMCTSNGLLDHILVSSLPQSAAHPVDADTEEAEPTRRVCLSELNDAGWTFAEIADIIEAHWRDL